MSSSVALSMTFGSVLLIRSDGEMKAILSPGTKCFARIGDGMLSDGCYLDDVTPSRRVFNSSYPELWPWQ